MNGINNIINNIKDCLAVTHRSYLLIISSTDYVVYYKYTACILYFVLIVWSQEWLQVGHG